MSGVACGCPVTETIVKILRNVAYICRNTCPVFDQISISPCTKIRSGLEVGLLDISAVFEYLGQEILSSYRIQPPDIVVEALELAADNRSQV
jgi:hypothetical protein